MKRHNLPPENSLLFDAYKDSENKAFEQLKKLSWQNSKLPEYAKFTPVYTDKTTKGLTKCVTDLIKFSGYHVERTGCYGTPIKERNGKIRLVESYSQVGTSDLKACINGRWVSIEIKNHYTKDKQSEAQKKYQSNIEKYGGVYVIASSFPQFYDWFIKFAGGGMK